MTTLPGNALAGCGRPTISLEEIHSLLLRVTRILKSATLTKERKHQEIRATWRYMAQFAVDDHMYAGSSNGVPLTNQRSPTKIDAWIIMRALSTPNTNTNHNDIYQIGWHPAMDSNAILRHITIGKDTISANAEELSGQPGSATAVAQVLNFAYSNTKHPVGRMNSPPQGITLINPYGKVNEDIGPSDPWEGSGNQCGFY